MHTTQLVCPHCKSSLSFGVDIAAGTPVNCLICMQTFAAANPVKAPLKQPAASAAPAGKSAAVSVKPAVKDARPSPRPTKSAPTREREESSGSGTSPAILVFTVALLLLLTAGLGFGVWKMTVGRNNSTTEPDKQVADGTKKTEKTADPIKNPGTQDPPKDVKKNPNDPPPPKDKKNGGNTNQQLDKPPPPLSEDDEEELRKKIQQETNPKIVRQPDPPPKVDVKQPDPEPKKPKVVPPKVQLVGLTQKRIDDTIARGIVYLKKSQKANGTWGDFQEAGHAALGGLTLLECNVPANDEAVQRAAAFIRPRMAMATGTYEMAATILFLDRLGDPRDRPLIQGLALRLMVNQTEGGAWGYNGTRTLSGQDMHQLYCYLQSHRPSSMAAPKAVQFKRDPSKFNDPFEELGELITTRGVKFDPPPQGGGTPLIPPDPVKSVMLNPNGMRPEQLSVMLQQTWIVKNHGIKKEQRKKNWEGAPDNSNTQFALLALWAARRHDVVTDQALVGTHQYFLASQNGDGGWGYMPGQPTRDTMINIGLLGLAVGHGVSPEVVGGDVKKPIIKPALQDPNIQRGLQLLARYIGQPVADPDKVNLPMHHLYMLWCVERVAVLYDLQTIGGKDWYSWGAQILVRNQRADGEWYDGNHHNVNAAGCTCFALLFLRRSNLVQDLTENFRIGSFIQDPK